MKVITLSANARINEVGGTAENILNIYSSFTTISDETLVTIFSQLREQVDLFIIAIERNKVYSDLDLFDKARDESYRALYTYLHGCSKLPLLTANAQSATKLMTVFEKYGLGLVRLSYTEQTAQIESLQEELSSSENATLINDVTHLSGMVSNLKNAQLDFKNAYVNYVSKISAYKEGASASELMPMVVSIINDKLLVYLSAMAKMKPEVYDLLFREITIEIERQNHVVSLRATKK
ncbi:MAG: DUF6261 family protein [Mangrovibacterium sp.]